MAQTGAALLPDRMFQLFDDNVGTCQIICQIVYVPGCESDDGRAEHGRFIVFYDACFFPVTELYRAVNRIEDNA